MPNDEPHLTDSMRLSAALFSEVSLKNRIEAVLHRTDHAIYEFGNVLFNQAGSSFQQARVLAFIHFNKGCNQKAVEKLLQVRSASVTVLLNTMSGKGFIEKNRNPDDGRETVLTLTPKGKRVLAKCRDVFETIGEVVGRGVSEEEVETVRRVLKKMAGNCLEAQARGWNNLHDGEDGTDPE